MKKSTGKYAYSLKTERVKEKDFPYAGEQLTCTSELVNFVHRLQDSDVEKMLVIYLDAQNKLCGLFPTTKTLVECAKLFDILVHDHLIVAGERFFSFREEGLM
ncbi:MAG: hypothetical protein NT106_13280 [Candidatus Sumerlaeota bacterium]|nr:hypothetical protein [Candidatus Sumerlaeota bacterium]